MRELLAEAQQVVPGIDEMVLEEAAAGLRPGTPDNAPLIGEADGVVLATGHHRNGILLAPFTAGAVLAVLDGAAAPDGFSPIASPRRCPRDLGQRRAARRPARHDGGGARRAARRARARRAVAVDGEVVPRGAWEATELAGGARVEVVTAVQGG